MTRKYHEKVETITHQTSIIILDPLNNWWVVITTMFLSLKKCFSWSLFHTLTRKSVTRCSNLRALHNHQVSLNLHYNKIFPWKCKDLTVHLKPRCTEWKKVGWKQSPALSKCNLSVRFRKMLQNQYGECSMG